ncbi:hypothetical protein ElyMa_002966700 [Elysia marginata]|uniref:Uncharacterized protein n=1 Tax=Elysia marginata TaxID=1093978 RepID=A0AAV4IBR9_9GAST|nr:hypothetical protein ElyMa_002966700 [Elysia marginata]
MRQNRPTEDIDTIARLHAQCLAHLQVQSHPNLESYKYNNILWAQCRSSISKLCVSMPHMPKMRNTCPKLPTKCLFIINSSSNNLYSNLIEHVCLHSSVTALLAVKNVLTNQVLMPK